MSAAMVLRVVCAKEAATARKPVQEERERPAQELAFYRKHTEGMMRRYLKMSMEAGRVPSLLGREMFRTKVTSYRVRSFEDVVIFVHDIERCLKRLNKTEQMLVMRIAVQQYTQGEVADMMGMSLRSVSRQYGMAVDRLTGILLECKLLEPMVC